MHLKELLQDVDVLQFTGPLDVEVTGVAYHTNGVRPGTLFVAIKGVKTDGHKFIPEAVARGAKVIVTQDSQPVTSYQLPVIVVDDTRKALAAVSANFFGHPSRKLKLIGVTGTNGKTSVAYLVESIWREAGFNPGVVGTVNWRFGGRELAAPHTTPESYDLQKLLREMLDDGVNHVVVEVSSHALDQMRVIGLDFDAAVFTNLTQDHLDYHGNMDRYFSAKLKLFTEVLQASEKDNKWAVVNVDDEYGKKIAQLYNPPSPPLLKGGKGGIIWRTFGSKSGTDVRVFESKSSIEGNWMRIATPRGELACTSPLKGVFNISNILAAVAVTDAMGFPLEAIKRGLEAVKIIPGRLEEVPNSKGVTVFVDYAHTPDALKNVILAINSFKKGRLITVFGCGGDRDALKRPIMGEIASRLSDITICTSDNPRSEDPSKIIEEIMVGAKEAQSSKVKGQKSDCGVIIEEDRRRAIMRAVEVAKKGDIILIAGKGHEAHQIIGNERVEFDDREVVGKCLSV